MIKDFKKTNRDYIDNITNDVSSEIFYEEKDDKRVDENSLNPILKCFICKNQKSKENRIVLTCEHSFHIKCIVDRMEVPPFIDEEVLKKFKCLNCDKVMDYTEISFIYNKFLMNSKKTIEEYDGKINALDSELQILKNELRSCYEIKKRLEIQKENAKQVVLTINTIL